jgi:hypothetical protein
MDLESEKDECCPKFDPAPWDGRKDFAAFAGGRSLAVQKWSMGYTTCPKDYVAVVAGIEG